MSRRMDDGIDSSSSDEEHTTTAADTSTDEEEVNSETQTPQSGSRNLDIPAPALRVAPGGTVMENNPNDEVYHITDERNISTPPRGQRNPSTSLGTGSMSGSNAAAGGQMMLNNPNDERLPVHGADTIPTPRARQHPSDAPESYGGSHGTLTRSEAHLQRNEEVDSQDAEEEEEDDEDSVSGMVNIAGQRPEAIMEAEVTAGNPVLTNLEYNPATYAKVNANASSEMRSLFERILDYQPFVAELPAKLRPFIPDYIPAVGDLDPFVKVPRPDGRPDGLGLYVIDEPTIPQSNPAVVQLELRATNVHGADSTAQVVDSFENAASRPEVIDRWISDVKKVHYKKPLPTVNYQRPMPEIETLMQLWPQEFEDLLNSDMQFPPSQIDLDIEQYVRTLCAIADIPTYNSLIDSLHVMFTLYEDFRGNQHFQHE